MKKIPAKTGAEYDWITGWRKVLCYTGRSGVGKSIKRQMNKRGRKEGKKERTDD